LYTSNKVPNDVLSAGNNLHDVLVEALLEVNMATSKMSRDQGNFV